MTDHEDEEEDDSTRRQVHQLRAAVNEDETRAHHLQLIAAWVSHFVASLSHHRNRETERALAYLYAQRYERFAAAQTDKRARLQGQALSNLWYLAVEELTD